MDGLERLNSPVSYKSGRYLIQKQDLLTLCEKHETPFFIYDLNTVISRYKALGSYFNWPSVKMLYAMKANYNIDILKALKAEGAWLDVVSPGEALLALKLGYDKARLLYTANNMTTDEMRLVSDLGLLMNIDSLSGLKRFGEIAPESDVCLRFNSDVVAGENEKVQTGGDKTKFGLRLEDAAAAKAICDAHKLNVVGLHEHTGSGIADAEKVCEGMRNLLSIDAKNLFPDLRFVDFGGGFKVPYHPDEKKVDYVDLGSRMSEIFSDFCKRYGRNLDLYFEPGKFVVAESGLLIVQVNTIKNNRGLLIAGTNSGFPQLIRPVFYDAYHHILNVSNPTGPQKTYDVCGNICETGDQFAKDRQLPEIREGDYLAILNAGAYCFSMASIYNLRPLPAELVVKDGQVALSRPKTSSQTLIDDICRTFDL